MLGFLQQEALGNEQRKIGIHMPGSLEAVVKLALDLLPDGISVGPDDHAALNGRIVGQFGLPHHIEIPA